MVRGVSKMMRSQRSDNGRMKFRISWLWPEVIQIESGQAPDRSRIILGMQNPSMSPIAAESMKIVVQSWGVPSATFLQCLLILVIDRLLRIECRLISKGARDGRHRTKIYERISGGSSQTGATITLCLSAYSWIIFLSAASSLRMRLMRAEVASISETLVLASSMMWRICISSAAEGK